MCAGPCGSGLSRRGWRFAVWRPAPDLPRPTREALEASIEEAVAGIDLAADLGASCIRTFGGSRGSGELHGIVHRTAEAYQRVMDRAVEKGVRVLMETHDEWCVSTQVREVVERVNHPHLRVLWDLMHTQRFMERPQETFQTIGPSDGAFARATTGATRRRSRELPMWGWERVRSTMQRRCAC